MTTIALPSDGKPMTVGQMIQGMSAEIQRALPRGLDGDRMARLALTEVRKSDLARQKGTSKQSLSECSPASMAGSLLTAAAIGVEVGTPEAYLVPYKGECSLIIGYQGYTKLYWQHPTAQYLTAEAVYERDEFDYGKGLAPYLKHKPARGDRGRIIFYYAAVSLTTGGQHFEVLTPEEVKELRNGKVGGNGGIADPMHWMERKTAIRQVLKPMPKSTQLSLAVNSDERGGTELLTQRRAEVASIEGGQMVDTATGELLESPDSLEPDQAVLDEIAAGR
jgi:recombination protein RecT